MSEETQEENKQELEQKPSLKVQANKEQIEKIKAIFEDDQATKLANLEAENKQLKEILDKTGGNGVLPASLNNEVKPEGLKEYDSFEQMVDELRKAGDVVTLNKIFEKGILGMCENPQASNFTYSDKWENGTSCIKKVLDRQNEKARGKK